MTVYVAAGPLSRAPSAEGVIELAPDVLGPPIERIAADEAWRAPGLGPAIGGEQPRRRPRCREGCRRGRAGRGRRRADARAGSRGRRPLGRDRRPATPRRPDHEPGRGVLATRDDLRGVGGREGATGGGRGPRRSQPGRAPPSGRDRRAGTLGPRDPSPRRRQRPALAPPASRTRPAARTRAARTAVARRRSRRGAASGTLAASAASIVARVSAVPSPVLERSTTPRSSRSRRPAR